VHFENSISSVDSRLAFQLRSKLVSRASSTSKPVTNKTIGFNAIAY